MSVTRRLISSRVSQRGGTIPAELLNADIKTGRVFKDQISAYIFREAASMKESWVADLKLKEKYVTMVSFKTTFEQLMRNKNQIKNSHPTFAALLCCVAVTWDSREIAEQAVTFLCELVSTKGFDPNGTAIIIPIVWNGRFLERENQEKLCRKLIEIEGLSKFISIYCDFLKKREMNPTQTVTNSKNPIMFLEFILNEFEPSEEDIAKIGATMDYTISQTTSTTIKNSATKIKGRLEEFKRMDDVEDERISPPAERFAHSTPGKWSDRRSQASFQSSPSRFVSPEMLDGLLDEVETGNCIDICKTLSEVSYQLKKLPFPKGHSLRTFFMLALQAWGAKGVTERNHAQLFALMQQINVQDGRTDELFKMYLAAAKDKKIPKDYLEQCYQDFVRKNRGKSSTDFPISLRQHEAMEVRDDVELAFSCLSNWESAYDGVARLWKMLKEDPSMDIQYHFDNLDYSQKCYLVQGIRLLIANNATDDSKEMEEAVSDLESRMDNESKGARVARAAQELGGKFSDIIENSPPTQRQISKIPARFGRTSALSTGGDALSYRRSHRG